ncbi:cysteine protease StiP family protein [Paenibacillus alginolyticus]|uniref:Cysteine protease StiP family protein n=1 Tax=Paenibacillus alginolyticus TaxID=59839 RepID=A0ABT4G6N1_9BACL|nr:cysteine protease StiP family protein [Paenibacillus alginolyticus]MCY9668924.1 cysteine protease StiP family protein [Paenibacillus alginolyticus]MCY9691838.1 cysteine protease StiP family protein [Paenibacillus alginolyticus]MEC0143198.1 cysteine protease StiP family protein [Paenibacillus alginolyticus]
MENWRVKPIEEPTHLGSYPASDVTFLLKDLSEVKLEKSMDARELAIQSGTHYSEMLPQEHLPTPDYLKLYRETLQMSAKKVALAVGTTAELIRNKKGPNTVLVSLARAGTPVGILIRRYLQEVHQLDLPHYSISIIRGKGIDENALFYILQKHPDAKLQFVDGWTGKGAIRRVLVEACSKLERDYGIKLDDDLAVLADPGHCTDMFGTREDFLIPSACLNAVVSGLMSRTVLREDLIGPHDFHGSKYYKEWLDQDLSNHFIVEIVPFFGEVVTEAQHSARELLQHPPTVSWKGLRDIQAIQNEYQIADINLIKPGVGETTRVLLRRVPWRILVDRLDNPNIRHILLLAEARDVPIEVYPDLTYSCCGIIKSVKGDAE